MTIAGTKIRANRANDLKITVMGTETPIIRANES